MAISAFAIALYATVEAAPLGSTVEIKSVDNYAGNSNVFTDKPNTTIKVVELDADKKPVRSWTGTTDSEGKITIPAGHNLSKPYLRAETADPKMAEFITPSSLESGMPFTFSASGTVSGTVISVQTVQGEVVATQRPDRYGRVFLPAGLAAGSYLLASRTGNNSSISKIDVKPKPQFDLANAMVANYELPQMLGQQKAVNLFETVRIKVAHFTSDALSLAATCSSQGAGKSAVPVLAASPHEIVLAKLGECNVQPGPMQLEVTDKQTGKSAVSNSMIAYSAIGKLTQVTVPSGMETHLVVSVAPANLGGTIHARILSGPVTFVNATGEMSLPLMNGVADFCIDSLPGSIGTFNVGWSLDAPWLLDQPSEKKQKPGDTEAIDDDGWVKFVDEETKRTGKKRIISDKDGVRREEIRYDDDKSYAIVTTTTTKTGKTVSTDTTIPGASEGESTVIEETIGYDADGNQISGERKTWKRKSGERTLDKSEKWVKGKGWK